MVDSVIFLWQNVGSGIQRQSSTEHGSAVVCSNRLPEYDKESSSANVSSPISASQSETFSPFLIYKNKDLLQFYHRYLNTKINRLFPLFPYSPVLAWSNLCAAWTLSGVSKHSGGRSHLRGVTSGFVQFVKKKIREM